MLHRIFNPLLRLILFTIVLSALPPATPRATMALGAAPASAASVVRADSRLNRADASITSAANASPNGLLNAPALTGMFTGECDTDNGSILREYWTGISGNAISDLTGSPDYPNSPSGSSQPASFEAPEDFDEHYGTRMRGYLCPPQDGDYTFWIASDDNGELWLSTTGSPANKVLIASVPEWTPSREWYWYTSQQSEPIALLGGERYYIEALQKDGEGGDNLAVAWQGPDITQEVIPGTYLVPFDDPAPTPTPAGTPTPTATPTQTPTPTATPTVTPTPACVDPYETDNTAAQAKPFTVGSTQTHAFCTAFDRDWVAFQAIAGKTYTFETLNLAAGVDTYLALYSTDQTTQLYNNDDLDNTTLRSYFSYTITTSGTYYVRVQQTNNSGNPGYSYDLRIGRPCNDDYEPNNTATQATAFTIGSTQTHIVCQPAGIADVDWVVFTTTVTQTYQIETSSAGPGLTLSLKLYQSNGTTLIDSVTSVSNASATLTVELPIGTYYATTGMFIGFTGTSYTLRIAPYLREVPHLTMTPTLPPGPTPTATPTPAPAAIATEVAIRENVNQQRLNAGLAPLADQASLEDAARAHSQDMAANGFLGHTGSDGSQPVDRAQRAGYAGSYVGENVAGGSVPFDPVAGWMTSSGHRLNILRPQYREFGAGTVGYTSTNVFASRANVYPIFINNGAEHDRTDL